jgi:hypothetical protein
MSLVAGTQLGPYEVLAPRREALRLPEASCPAMRIQEDRLGLDSIYVQAKRWKRVAILAEHGVIPYQPVHLQSLEPAEQHVVVPPKGPEERLRGETERHFATSAAASAAIAQIAA